MHTTAYETSISELCRRLDALSHSVAEEFAQHQRRVQALREHGDAADSPEEVRGAVLASAYALLEAVESLEAQLAGVRRVIAEQQALLASLHEESRTDVLTGRLNRRAFDEEILRRAAEARRSGRTLGLVMLDIDHFKRVNDTYGHVAGDKVLKGVANVLTNSLREMDIVARFGGEEFAVILPEANLLNACRAAERARLAIGRSTFQFEEHELAVTASAGVAILAGDHAAAIKHADDALYAAKQAGRNRVFAYKDGYCQPLHREPTGEHGAQRRRWMRFLVEDFTVRLRRGNGPWQPAHVKDESLTGIGLAISGDPRLSVGDVVQIDYCDETRSAEVMFVGPAEDEDGQHADGTRLGLRWCDAVV